jgi:hypothetical protein
MAHRFMSSVKTKSLIHFMRKISWLLQTAILILAACNTTPEVDPTGEPSEITLPNGSVISTCNTVVWGLNAGGSTSRKTGDVTVSNDNTTLYIQVSSNFGFQDIANNLKVMVVSNLELVPTGTPLFKWQASVPTGLNSHTFIIPFSEIEAYNNEPVTCTTPLYLFIHADVYVDKYQTTDYAAGGNTCGRTANCGCQCYGFYQGKCCENPPPITGSTETAFAKGGYVFTTDGKSNPENLPTLSLSKNRWGWAINIKTPGQTTYPIYAAAGLNDISKGTLVGTLTVNWNGSAATVKYQLNAGFGLNTVHIYVGDGKPTTIAPGLYGHTVEFNPLVTSYTSGAIAAVDGDGDGIWIIAHAGVTGNF